VRNVRTVRPGDVRTLLEEIRAAQAADPAGRIILAGWSGGSLTAWDVANELATRGERLDALVYLDSAWIKRRVRERGHPANADRILLVYRRRHEPPPIEGAEHVTVPTSNHLAVATHPVTFEALAGLVAGAAGDPP
jgi:thioesterase domain-containing protein